MSDAIRSERLMTARQPRPIYTVRLRPLPGVDAVLSTSIIEQRPGGHTPAAAGPST